MNEEMRKEFESWYKLTLISESKCSYKEREALFDYSFMVWQASREAMRPIRLPIKMKNTESTECYYHNCAIDDCKEAIERAGHKVAP